MRHTWIHGVFTVPNLSTVAKTQMGTTTGSRQNYQKANHAIMLSFRDSDTTLVDEQ